MSWEVEIKNHEWSHDPLLLKVTSKENEFIREAMVAFLTQQVSPSWRKRVSSHPVFDENLLEWENNTRLIYKDALFDAEIERRGKKIKYKMLWRKNLIGEFSSRAAVLYVTDLLKSFGNLDFIRMLNFVKDSTEKKELLRKYL